MLTRIKSWWALRHGVTTMDEYVDREMGFVDVQALDCFGRRVGYGRLTQGAAPGCFTLADVYVEPTWRSKRVGRALLHSAVAAGKKLGARVLSGSVMPRDLQTSPWLLKWYSRSGFKVVTATSAELPGASFRVERAI